LSLYALTVFIREKAPLAEFGSKSFFSVTEKLNNYKNFLHNTHACSLKIRLLSHSVAVLPKYLNFATFSKGI
jgi:hypothetical protein